MIKWYAIQSKFRKEGLVCEQLRIRQLDAFYPSLRVQPVNPRASTTKPYFPGYIFGRIDIESIGRSIINWIPGAIGVVSFGDEPVPVPDHLVERLRQHLETINSTASQLADRFRIGDAVAIQSGPFAGYEAIFNAHLPGRDRVEVLLKLLQGAPLRVQLPMAQIALQAPHS